MNAAATWEKIDTLTPWEKNPRRNDASVAHVASSIQRFGFGAPLLVRASDRVVIAGHTRLKAAQKLGLDKVPVRFLDLDPAQARALALADNKLGELAVWDDAVLAEVLAELDEEVDVSGLGWSEEELEVVLQSLDAVPFSEDTDLSDLSEESSLMVFRVSVPKSMEDLIKRAASVYGEQNPDAPGGQAERLGMILIEQAEKCSG